VPAAHRLNAAMSAAGYDLSNDPQRLALIAVALAYIKESGPKVARTFGSGDPPALSPIRFNTLIRTTAPGALWRPLTRALAVIRGHHPWRARS